MSNHILSYKCRIYPKDEQIEEFELTLDSCQSLFNILLENYQNVYNTNKKPKNLRKYLTEQVNQIQSKSPILSQLDVSTTDDIVMSLVKSISNKSNPLKIKPKNRKNRVKSFLLRKQEGIDIFDNILELGKYGIFKLHYGKNIDFAETISFRIINKNHKWYVLIVLKPEDISPFHKTNKFVGIDLGITHLIILSNGEKYDPPDLTDVNDKINNLQHNLSTKDKDSSNYNICLDRLTNAYEYRTNIVLDYYHKLSTQLVVKYDIIAMETLSISEMISDPRFSKNIYHRYWYKLIHMIKYKCELYGKKFIQVDRRFPSTKLCNNCGYKFDDITLDIRTWKCPKCGSIHDRDINAAKNILKEAVDKKYTKPNS